MPVQTSFSLAVGQSIRSDSGVWYRNLQILGRGGNSTTFLVLATSGVHKGVMFALKVFQRLEDGARRQAFLDEVRFLESVDHPAILRVYDAGIFRCTDGSEYPFVSAEYLPQTLHEVTRARRASLPEKLAFALQLLSALVVLEASDPQVVHRDIKPQNVFVKGRSCVLGDFGLMKLQSVDDDTDRAILKESALPGMPYFYRTPDLIAYARGESGITPKSDVFQLGLVLAELFTGWNPAVRPDNILDDLVLEELRAIPGDMGAGIQALIRRMLVIDPADRESASQLVDGWKGTFVNVCEMAGRLEGRPFQSAL